MYTSRHTLSRHAALPIWAAAGGPEAAAPADPADAGAAKAIGSAVAGTGATGDAGDPAGDQAVATSAPLAANAPCATRIIEGTLAARLVAVDARTGDRKSVAWGKSVHGRVDLGGRRNIKKKT